MNRSTTLRSLALALALAEAAFLLPARPASACGCFAPPNVATPVLQAGERILFVPQKDGTLLMHVQIQYSGNAKDFGWLLPVPTVPTVSVGTDELFTRLDALTGPRFILNRTFQSCRSSLDIGCGGSATSTSPRAAGGAFDAADAGSPLVVQDSVGPYDFAVLKADDKTAMLDWLNTNHYFIPGGTDAAITPYVHAGAYFLALRLASGKSAGDVAPVVLKFQSDYAMIPITLTAVGAQPNMGIAVWVLGQSRAVPRNYNHTVINDAAIDWLGNAGNYGALVTRAVGEAAAKHSFVTEFAGPSSIMKNVLDPVGRFGSAADLYSISDAGAYLQYLQTHGFIFNGPLVGTLQKAIPEPAQLVNQGVAGSDFYARFSYWKNAAPQAFQGVTYNYDATKLTDEIWKNVVTPTLAAGALFTQSPFLTYLYTTLSPEDMNADPTFGFNPDLPAVSNTHTATLDTDCDGNGHLTTDSGLAFQYPKGAPSKPLGMLPGSRRIEVLRESGAPKVLTDNTAAISMVATGSCAVDAVAPRRPGLALAALLLAMTIGYRTARRRRV